MLRLARLPVRMRLPCCLGGFGGAACLVWRDAAAEVGAAGIAGAFFPYWYVGLKESACNDRSICMKWSAFDQYAITLPIKKKNVHHLLYRRQHQGRQQTLQL